MPCLDRFDSPVAGQSNAHYSPYCKLYGMFRKRGGIFDKQCVMSWLNQDLRRKKGPAAAHFLRSIGRRVLLAVASGEWRVVKVHKIASVFCRGSDGRGRQPRASVRSAVFDRRTRQPLSPEAKVREGASLSPEPCRGAHQTGHQPGGGATEFSRIPLLFPASRMNREPFGFPLVAEFVRILPGQSIRDSEKVPAALPSLVEAYTRRSFSSVETPRNSHEFRYCFSPQE